VFEAAPLPLAGRPPAQTPHLEPENEPRLITIDLRFTQRKARMKFGYNRNQIMRHGVSRSTRYLISP
jgi:hypothetical protein